MNARGIMRGTRGDRRSTAGRTVALTEDNERKRHKPSDVAHGGGCLQ